MMGHRGKLKSGAEYDALTRWRKRILHWKPGETRQVKRKYNKRQRKQAKGELRQSDGTRVNHL